MELPFYKYNGLGNDFIIFDLINNKFINLFDEISKDFIRKLCDRNFGIGADGIILAMPPYGEAHIRMRIINSDGSEPEMCGNGIRCLIKYAFDHDLLINKEFIKVNTKAGDLVASIDENLLIRMDMGSPTFVPEQIPTLLELNDLGVPQGLVNIDNKATDIYSCGMGNPHLIIFNQALENNFIDINGPILEDNHFFPSKTNVHFVNVVDRKNINVKVWERGCGKTLACGTGACAVHAVCSKLDLCDYQTKVNLPGGSLEIEWPNKLKNIYMKGPAMFSYRGYLDIS